MATNVEPFTGQGWYNVVIMMTDLSFLEYVNVGVYVAMN